MRLTLLRLALAEWRRRPLPALLLILLALLGGAAAQLLPGLSAHLAAAARLAFTGSNDERSLLVSPGGPQAAASFERRLLEPTDLDWLGALDGLESQAVLWGVPLPTTVTVKLPMVLDSEQFCALYALDADAVPAEHRSAWTSTAPGPVPLLVHPQVIRFYNLGFADRYGLPRLSDTTITQLNLTLLVGKDLFLHLDGAFAVPARILGFSADVSPWGVAVPLAQAQAWVGRLPPAVPDARLGPVQVRLRFQDQESLATARPRIVESGLVVDGIADLAGAIARAQGLIDRAAQVLLGILALAGLAVAALTALSAAAERHAALRCWRDLGARRYQIWLILSAGASLGAAAGAVLGVRLAAGQLPELANRIAGGLLGPDFPLPEVAASDPWLAAWAAAIAAGLVCISALPAVLRVR